jgi:hypothetical protein
MLLADEVARRAQTAQLDPQIQMQAWDDTAAVSFDRDLWAELTSLRFLADAYNMLIMGPVGVGKTFLANALGHIAVRRHYSVHTERVDRGGAACASRLGSCHPAVHPVDDLALHPALGHRDQRLVRAHRRTPPRRLNGHHQQPRATGDPDHDGRPPPRAIGDGPAAISRL